MFASIRLLVATPAHLDLELLCRDVNTAILNSELDEEIYMKMIFKLKGNEHKVLFKTFHIWSQANV